MNHVKEHELLMAAAGAAGGDISFPYVFNPLTDFIHSDDGTVGNDATADATSIVFKHNGVGVNTFYVDALDRFGWDLGLGFVYEFAVRGTVIDTDYATNGGSCFCSVVKSLSEIHYSSTMIAPQDQLFTRTQATAANDNNMRTRFHQWANGAINPNNGVQITWFSSWRYFRVSYVKATKTLTVSIYSNAARTVLLATGTAISANDFSGQMKYLTTYSSGQAKFAGTVKDMTMISVETP